MQKRTGVARIFSLIPRALRELARIVTLLMRREGTVNEVASTGKDLCHVYC